MGALLDQRPMRERTGDGELLHGLYLHSGGLGLLGGSGVVVQDIVEILQGGRVQTF